MAWDFSTEPEFEENWSGSGGSAPSGAILFPGRHMTGASRVVVDVDGIAVSALLCEARQPRAVVLALHGGPRSRATSTTRTGPGCPCCAPARPSASPSSPSTVPGTAVRPRAPRSSRPRSGASTSPTGPWSDSLRPARPRGAGVFVLAHSIGSELGVRMAADERRGPDLLGLELAGTGRRQHDDAAGILGDWRHRPPNSGVRDLLWQPSRLYADDVVGGARISSRSPAYEGFVARSWIDTFPQLAPLSGSPSTTPSANTSGYGAPGPRRSPTSPPCSPRRPGLPSTNRRAADTT